jgi:hypothetical protein
LAYPAAGISRVIQRSQLPPQRTKPKQKLLLYVMFIENKFFLLGRNFEMSIISTCAGELPQSLQFYASATPFSGLNQSRYTTRLSGDYSETFAYCPQSRLFFEKTKIIMNKNKKNT